MTPRTSLFFVLLGLTACRAGGLAPVSPEASPRPAPAGARAVEDAGSSTCIQRPVWAGTSSGSYDGEGQLGVAITDARGDSLGVKYAPSRDGSPLSLPQTFVFPGKPADSFWVGPVLLELWADGYSGLGYSGFVPVDGSVTVLEASVDATGAGRLRAVSTALRLRQAIAPDADPARCFDVGATELSATWGPAPDLGGD